MSARRPFRVLGLQHVAIGALDKAPLRQLWVELLGAEQLGVHRDEAANLDEVIVTLGDGIGLVELDLMQPIDPACAPSVHQPALHHVGLWVDNLGAAIDWLSARGIALSASSIRKGVSGYETVFFDGEGVRIGLVQAPREIIEATDDMTRSRLTYVPDLVR